MIKFGKSNMLLIASQQIFNDVIKFGLNLSGFNISLKTPVPKCKNKNLTNSREFQTYFGHFLKTDRCKHASFLIKEIIIFYEIGGSPCYVVSLDLSKVFDRLRIDGLFY
jgi:hypothetical protein